MNLIKVKAVWPELDAQIAAWTSALRSGNYPQTLNVLHNDAGYCCLGVLYEHCTAGPWKRNQIVNSYQTLTGSSAVLRDDDVSDDMMRFLRSAMGTSEAVMSQLTDANDNYATFNEIADLIEKLYEDYKERMR